MNNELIRKMEFECRDLTVLYVEDEEIIKEQMKKIFSRFFKTVFTASDGCEGLESFRTHKPDIVITDIRMPKMSGLEMIKEIQKEMPNEHIIITTGHSESSYLLEAIDEGVEQFLIKPISTEKLYKAISKLANYINMEKESEAYKSSLEKAIVTEITKNLEYEKENRRVLTEILNAYPNPVLVLKQDFTLHYQNRAAERSFDYETSTVVGKEIDLNSKTVEYNGEKKSIYALDVNDNQNNIIALKTAHGKKVYRVIVDEVVLKDNEREKVYTFIDITVEEYRKIQIKNYSLRLEATILRYKKLLSTLNAEAQPLPQKEELPKKEVKEEIATKQQTQVIEKSDKVPASEYAEDIDDYILGEISELQEIESDMEDKLYAFEISKDEESIKAISAMFLKYSSVISLMFEFEDLSFAVKDVSQFLEELDLSTLDDKGLTKLALIARAILSDLTQWRNNIFINREALDIHYLDDSLLSSCLQLEMVILDKEESSEDNDLDLF